MVTYPKDWTEKTFEQFIKIKRGASPRPIEAYLTKSHNGVNWIKIGDASKGSKYITATKEKITEQGAVHSVSVFPGDFILSNSMSFGRPYILKIDGCIHDGWLRLFDFSEDADGEFLYYLLSSNYVQNQYSAFAAGSGVQNLNKEVVKKVSIYLPPMTEQKRIVETLSSFDEYIDDLAELIEKKKNIRDGALEDLVTGKTRLEGYSCKWSEQSLKSLSVLITKQTGFDYSERIKESLLTSKRADTIPFIQNKDFEKFQINYETDFHIPMEVAMIYLRYYFVRNVY